MENNNIRGSSTVTAGKAIEMMRRGLASYTNCYSCKGENLVEVITMGKDVLRELALPTTTHAELIGDEKRQMTSWGAIQVDAVNFEIPLTVLESIAGISYSQVESARDQLSR